MELRQLECFVEVAQHGTLTRAAVHLRLSQPALTRQVHRLEREVGSPLFHRTPTGMALTPAGAALLPHARAVLSMVATAAEVARTAGPAVEAVHVGLAPGVPGEWLSAVLGHVRQRVPHAQLQCTDADSAAQLRDLRSGRLDVALVHQAPPPALAAGRVRAEPHGVAVRPGAGSAVDGRWPMRLLDRRRVLIHAREQHAVGHDQLTTRAHELDVAPEWLFASFTEHARQCADAAGADLVVLTAHSAGRLLPGWAWYPLSEPSSLLETYAVRQRATRPVVAEVHGALLDASGLTSAGPPAR